MALLNIQENTDQQSFTVWSLGFRPFFIAAGYFAVISMSLWLLDFNQLIHWTPGGLSGHLWHAHEMVFGYGMAVVAGFLLTAIRNWTGVQTWQHSRLIALLVLWVSARILLMTDSALMLTAATLDLAFNLLLFLACLQPIMQVRQWKQTGIISKLLLMALMNLLFYLGALGLVPAALYWGLYGGAFILVALVLTMGRRVLPFFIERAVGYPVTIQNPLWIDRSSLILFLALTVSEMFQFSNSLSSALAAALVFVSSWRLYLWHTPGIWKKPLLWGLYLAFVFINLGFLIYALLPWLDQLNRSLALHAFTYGGVGLVTLTMMSRISLGHTGRDINTADRLISVAHVLLTLGAVIRLLPAILWPRHYAIWITLSQLLWIAGFILFVTVYTPILTQPEPKRGLL